ncbi:hypothetical protein Avbf_08167, partial [Armadillidium vulgare]
MESLSLDIASVDEKDEQQMITLVDTSNLDGNDLVENSLPLVHHVLEPSDLSKDSSDKLYDSTHCLICNAQFGVSGRGAVHLFSDEVKTTSRLLELPIFLSSIIQRDLNSSNMHSTTICKKCFKFLDDIDSVESQLANMKQEITSKFFQTQVLIQHEKNLDELAKDECIYPESHISSDEKEYKITSRVRNKKKRGRGKKRTPAYVKLEVKEESDEPINFVDYVSADQNKVTLLKKHYHSSHSPLHCSTHLPLHFLNPVDTNSHQFRQTFQEISLPQLHLSLRLMNM